MIQQQHKTKTEHEYKVCLAGKAKTGKTSIFCQFIENRIKRKVAEDNYTYSVAEFPGMKVSFFLSTLFISTNKVLFFLF